MRAFRPDVPIAVFDLGLTALQRGLLGDQVSKLVRPDWDYDFPGRSRAPEVLKAELVKTVLPKYFPGHSVYMWLDADAWVQDWRAVDFYRAAAERRHLAITPEIDRAYGRYYRRRRLFGLHTMWNNYRKAFGWRVANRLGDNTTLNAGVFALHAEAPHWAAWQKSLARALRRSSFFLGGQTALNHAVYDEELPVALLPAYCNWIPGEARPSFDRQRRLFVEPHLPHEPIGIMHLAGSLRRSRVYRLGCPDGSTIETPLRYGATRALCRPPPSALLG